MCFRIGNGAGVFRIISIQIRHPGFWRVGSKTIVYKDRLGTIGIVIIIPGIIRVIIGTIIIIVAETKTLVCVPVVQIVPLITVTDFHPQVTVFLEVLLIPVTPVIFFFYTNILILRTGRGIVYIIRGLPSFVGGGTTAQCSYNECQE